MSPGTYLAQIQHILFIRGHFRQLPGHFFLVALSHKGHPSVLALGRSPESALAFHQKTYTRIFFCCSCLTDPSGGLILCSHSLALCVCVPAFGETIFAVLEWSTCFDMFG